MFRKSIVRKYVDGHIESLIGHNPSVYIRMVVRNIFMLSVAYGVFTIANGIWEGHRHITTVFGVLWLFLLARFIINFLNLYLDAIVLTPTGIAIFRREWLLEYKTEFFERNKIELISFEQNSLLDKIFLKGDIIISLDYNTSFSFENISNPKKRVSEIMIAKHTNQAPPSFEAEPNEQDKEKFDMLVETLGEVIQDYMTKKPQHKQSDLFDDAPSFWL